MSGGGAGATRGGDPVWEGLMYHTHIGHMAPLPPPPVNRQSDTTENINITSLASFKKQNKVHFNRIFRAPPLEYSYSLEDTPLALKRQLCVSTHSLNAIFITISPCGLQNHIDF